MVGGSLTVQIAGARSDSSSKEYNKGDGESNEFVISDKKNSFSTTSVVVKSGKNPSDLVKK